MYDEDTILVSTGLSDQKAKEVLESVIGQMSDGIWENTAQMNRYWKYMEIVEQDGEIFIKVDTENYSSGFRGKSADEIRRFVANKVKQIAKMYIEDYKGSVKDLAWDRNCTAECEYLNYHAGVTIQDAYRVYDKLLGRKDRIKTESKSSDDAGYYVDYADTHKEVMQQLMNLWDKTTDDSGNTKFVLDCIGKTVEIYRPSGDKKYSLFIDDKWYKEDILPVLKRMGINFYLGQANKNDVEETFKKHQILFENMVLEDNKKDTSVIVLSYGSGTRFPDRDTAIEFYEECVANTDPNGSENYSAQNILWELISTDKPVVYDTEDVTEYDYWVNKGKPVEDVSQELLNTHIK